MSDTQIPALFTNAYEAGKLAATARDRLVDYDPDKVGRSLPLSIGPNGLALHGEVAKAYEALLDTPRRARGEVAISELASFIAYANRHKAPESVVWAAMDDDEPRLVAVFNEHLPSSPDGLQVAGWRDHRAVYAMPWAPEWVTWCDVEGEDVHQDAFADFIEARMEDLIPGPGELVPTDVLQMARDLTVLTRGVFTRTVNVTTGASSLVCRNDTDVGSTVIPRAFLIAVPIFEGGQRYQVEVRVRFKLEHGRPTFAITLHRRNELERDAFGDARGTVAQQTGLLVVAGTP